MTVPEKREEEFSGQKFVRYLIKEGSKIPCDETFVKFNETEIPHFYNEDLYNRGRKFFYDNIFSLFYGKLLGLITVLANPSTLQILIHTKMSGSAVAAYKRYLSTIFHMYLWYESDLAPNSRIWRSIKNVKCKHNSASKRGCSNGMGRITQKDMALTQFGFMGFALTRQKMIGLHHAPEDGLVGFVHVWRVVGAMMGLEDRFNICRKSVKETIEICNSLIEEVFKPTLLLEEQDFVSMATNLVEGMWVMNPMIDSTLYLNIVKYTICDSSSEGNVYQKIQAHEAIKANFKLRILLLLHQLVMWSLQFRIFKIYYNNIQFLTLWLMRFFPFLAYFKYGYGNSHIKILTEDV